MLRRRSSNNWPSRAGWWILNVQPDSYYAQGSIAGSIHYDAKALRGNTGDGPQCDLSGVLHGGRDKPKRLHANGGRQDSSISRTSGAASAHGRVAESR